MGSTIVHYTNENGKEVAVLQEVYDYYQNAMEKLKEKEKRKHEEREKKGNKLIRMMNQLSFESPCINNCKLNEITNICEGCGRTIKEIMQWTFMTNEERKEIMKRVGGRSL